MVVYSAHDVLTFAKDLKRRRSQFYARASARAQSPGAKALLERLAEESDRQFQAVDLQIRQQSGGQTSRFATPAKASVTLDAMARGPFLDYAIDPQVTLTGEETTDEIGDIARGLAENTLTFYRAVREMVFVESGRDQIDLLISAEADPSTDGNESSPKTLAFEPPQPLPLQKAA